jgi:single-stranded DNA-binding protein
MKQIKSLYGKEKCKMKNIRNCGIVTGRLTKDVVVYQNRDGSRKIRFTVAAQNHFTNGDGKREAQFIPLEAFIPAGAQDNGPYDYLDKGDLVSCSYSVQNNNYKDRAGDMVYGIVLLVDGIALLETQSTKEARLVKGA